MQSNWPDASFRIATPLALLLFIPRPSVFLLWCAQQNQRDNAAHMGHGSSGSSPWHLRTAQSVDPMGIYHSKSLLEALPTLLRQAVFQWSSRELPFWAATISTGEGHGSVWRQVVSRRIGTSIISQVTCYWQQRQPCNIYSSSTFSSNLCSKCGTSIISQIFWISKYIPLYWISLNIYSNIPNILDIIDIPLGICGTSKKYPNWNMISQK